MYNTDVKKVVCINHVALLVKKLTQFEYNTLQDMSDSLMFCSGDIEVVCFPEINLPAFNRIAGTKENNSELLYCFIPLDEMPSEPPRERDPEHDFVQGLYRLVGTGIAEVDDDVSASVRYSHRVEHQ